MTFKEWMKLREAISLAYGGGSDPVGFDTQSDRQYASIKSRYHTFDGDPDESDDDIERMKKKNKDIDVVDKVFGFRKGDPLLKMQNKKMHKDRPR